jgi:phage major head subunit gpT-like protein
MLTGIDSAAMVADLFVGFSASFKSGFGMAAPKLAQLAMRVPSSTRTNHYPFLGLAPALREWLGDRQVKSLGAYDYSLTNRKFESTIAVKRDDIEDDLTGTLAPVFQRMGQMAAMHPDQLIAEAITANPVGYDGVALFSTAHPTEGAANQSNLDGSNSGPRWYLADLSKPIKPFVYQVRRDYEFKSFTSLDDRNVFERDEFEFGVSARAAVGVGLWQLIRASDDAITLGIEAADIEANEAALNDAYVAMTNITADNGETMDITPTHIICPPNLEMAFRRLVGSMDYPSGGSNLFRGMFQVISSPRLSQANQ